VGVGQAEVDIAGAAHTTIVVEAPGLGDEVQAIKAGILEIADILVVNKADRDGVQSTVNALHTMIDLGKSSSTVLHHGRLMTVQPSSTSEERWRPPIVKTIASESKGLEELMEAIAQHRVYLGEHPEGQQRGRMRAALELETILREALFNRLLQTTNAAQLELVVDRIAARELDPYSAAEQLLA